MLLPYGTDVPQESLRQKKETREEYPTPYHWQIEILEKVLKTPLKSALLGQYLFVGSLASTYGKDPKHARVEHNQLLEQYIASVLDCLLLT